MEKITYIEKQIKSTLGNDKYIKKAKTERIDFYKNNIDKVNLMQLEKIKEHNFNAEVVNHAHNLRKLALLPKLQIVKLERHAYSPEMNVLHFTKNRLLKVPQKTTLTDACMFAIQTLSIDYLKTLTA